MQLQQQNSWNCETELKRVQYFSFLHILYFSVLCSSWVSVRYCKKSRSPTETYRLVVFLVSLLQFDKDPTEQPVTRRRERLQLHAAVFLFRTRKELFEQNRTVMRFIPAVTSTPWLATSSHRGGFALFCVCVCIGGGRGKEREWERASEREKESEEGRERK